MPCHSIESSPSDPIRSIHRSIDPPLPPLPPLQPPSHAYTYAGIRTGEAPGQVALLLQRVHDGDGLRRHLEMPARQRFLLLAVAVGCRAHDEAVGGLEGQQQEEEEGRSRRRRRRPGKEGRGGWTPPHRVARSLGSLSGRVWWVLEKRVVDQFFVCVASIGGERGKSPCCGGGRAVCAWTYIHVHTRTHTLMWRGREQRACVAEFSRACRAAEQADGATHCSALQAPQVSRFLGRSISTQTLSDPLCVHSLSSFRIHPSINRHTQAKATARQRREELEHTEASEA